MPSMKLYALVSPAIQMTVKANPISFGVDGKQYIAIAAGYAIFVFGL